MFLLAGPSGVGKTETALALADLLFGGEAALTTINMSEYQESVELATLQWVAWFNHHRLMEPLGYIPPAEAEANYYRQLETAAAEPPST
nr:AAA family ATPase [Burkholderia sp. TSV86]